MTHDPFSPQHSGPFFLETAAAAAALRRLEAGLGTREPFLLLTGDPGTGKTALANAAIAQWKARVTVAFLAVPPIGGDELLEEIVLRFGARPVAGASRPRLVACLEDVLGEIADAGRVPMIVLDDAQRLSPEVLEDLRLLTNTARQAHRRLEVLLIGLPALETLLDRPELESLRQCVSVRARLEPLSAAETRLYLRHRIDAVGGEGANLFPRKTCNEIASCTGGIPRRINALASESLRLARAAGEATVQVKHLREAARALASAAPVAAVTTPREAEPVAAEEPTARAAEPEATPRAAPAARGPSPPPTAASDRAMSPPPTAAPDRPKSPPPTAAPDRAKSPPPTARGAEPDPASRATPATRATSQLPAHVERFERLRVASRWDADADPPPSVPTHHDPSEWVARFVGDQGPIRIGALASSPSELMDVETESAGDSTSSSEASEDPFEPRRSAPRSSRHGRSRHRPRGSHTRTLTIALATIVIVGATALALRAGVRVNGWAIGRSTATPPRVTTAASGPTAAPSYRATPPVTVTTVRPRSSSPAADSTRSVTQGSARSPARAVSRPAMRYTLQVGTFLDYESALAERVRLQELTGVETWVISPPEGSSDPHRVILGIYRSEDRARDAADMLLASQAIQEAAVVVPLPKRSARQ